MVLTPLQRDRQKWRAGVWGGDRDGGREWGGVLGEASSKLRFRQTSYNCNRFGDCGETVFHAACRSRSLEMVQLMIRSSKERNIDLNALTADFKTAFKLACFSQSFDTVKFLLENYKELGINIKKRNGLGQTALDLLDFPDEECRKLRHQVQLEFTKIEMSKIARIQNKRLREQRQRHVCTIPSKKPAPLSKKPRIDEE